MDGDFELEIRPDPEPDTYGVRVLRSPAGGEPAGRMRLDVDGILRRRPDLETAVLASGVPARGLPTASELPVRQVGELLFRALFADASVRGAYRASQMAAHQTGDRLRVVLRLSTPQLAALPWEALYDPETQGYVCRSQPLVRHVPAPYVPPPLEVRAPLRILGLVAAPRGYAELDAEAERRHLEQALARPVAEGLAELVWAPRASWEAIHDLLLSGERHILHFIGHGDYDAVTEEGVLVLEGEDGRPDRVEAGRLADLLREARPTPRLVVLNSCSSGRTGGYDLYSSTAATLVRSGISAVASMQFSVSDRAAVDFARAFYTTLVHGRTVDAAAVSGRVGILRTRNTLEWVTPVLHVRGNVTDLFAIKGPARPVLRPADPAPGTAPAAVREDPPAPDPSPRAASGSAAPVGLVVVGEGNVVVSAHDGSPVTVGPREPAAPEPAERHDTGSFALALSVVARTTLSANVNVVAWHPHRPLLAVGGYQKWVNFYSVSGDEPVFDVARRPIEVGFALNQVFDVAFHPHRTQMAVAARHRKVEIRQLADGMPVLTVDHGMWQSARAVAFSPGGTHLVTGTDSGTAHIWDLFTRTQVTLPHGKPVRSVAVSPDGTLVATGSLDYTDWVWDAATGDLLDAWSHTAPVHSVAFGPDSRLLVTGCGDGVAWAWRLRMDAETGQVTGRTRLLRAAHGAVVHSVAVSPDGRYLATGSVDHTVRVWSLTDGREMFRSTHGGAVRSVAFSADGRYLAAGGDDRTVHVWSVSEVPRATGRP
ncbi:CHAT domain-containing protein [Streptomyces sp. B1866]|uniref:CHAT domain-containing WD40 repeat protein n=1 Tax=Streptomyces sp. B1866 TaxID=3075431 RepID=UPI002891D84F|nr:CHAT domain-containing protein [Streptomyces sp. B1866]MDT3399138.1 CHAT domain-containing protein [Streptomyces sp. B1866]